MGLDLYFNRSKKTSEEIGYFRKVNFLVCFFERLGYTIENCVPVEINKGDAEDLLDTCNEVLENHDKAEKLLPTTEGFFFGTYDYDEYYFDDVKEVRDYVKNTLLPEFNKLEDDEYIEFEIWY